MRSRLISGLFLAIVFFVLPELHAQLEKKISFNGFLGVGWLPQSEKLNAAGQPTNIFGNYPPAPSLGAGVNYRFTDRFSLSNNLFFLFSSKSNHSFSATGLRVAFKYFPMKDWRKFSPYFTAGINMNFLNIKRGNYVEEYNPDSTANVIGSGIGVTKITYNRNEVKLLMVPAPGASLGAGVNFKITPKVTLFLDYTYNYNFTASSLIKENYPQNKANFRMHYVSTGITFKLLKPMKQMLATLNRTDWDGDPTVTIRGTVVYKNPKKSKELPIQMIDQKDTLLAVIPSEKTGYFEYRNLRADDYKFMLERKNKNVERADIKIVHDNSKVDIFEELPELEMMDDYESDNMITRDNNFSVILREGFQHEVDVTVLGNNVIGKITPVSYDTLCRNMLVLLKDLNDSVIAVSSPSRDCSYSFPNVDRGKYTVVFVRNGIDKDINFSYSFENPPLIRRQYNTEEDSTDYGQYEIVEVKEDTVDINDILLSKRYEQEITSTEAFPMSDGSNEVPAGEVPQERKNVPLTELQPGRPYSPEGEVKEPTGYGVQVAAFSDTENLKNFCDKLKQERSEPVFVQAVAQEDSYHPIIYRVIVGDYPDASQAEKERLELKKSGYDTVLRKHKKVSKSRGK